MYDSLCKGMSCYVVLNCISGFNLVSLDVSDSLSLVNDFLECSLKSIEALSC